MKGTNMKISKRAISAIGTILMLTSFVFIMRRIMQYDIDFSFSPIMWMWLLLIALAIACGLIFAAFNFRWLLGNLSALYLEPRLTIKTYCIANLYKYLPGSVMYVLGRNRLALEITGLTHVRVAGATVLEGMFIALAATAISGLFIYNYFIYFANQIGPIIWAAIGLLTLILAIGAIFFRKRLTAGLVAFREGAKGFNFKAMARLMGSCVLIMLVLGSSFVALLIILGQPIAWHQVTTLIGLYVLSWLMGFITPGAPGGLGVREAVILMVMGGVMYEGLLVYAVITHRILTIIGDVFAYCIALAYSKI